MIISIIGWFSFIMAAIAFIGIFAPSLKKDALRHIWICLALFLIAAAIAFK